MGRTGFLDKTILAAAQTMERSILTDSSADARGLLQAVDVRVKLISFLFILILISLHRTPEPLWVLSALGFVLAFFSGVPIGAFFIRVWLIVPLFSAAIALPAVLNVVTPGEPVLVLLKLPGPFAWGPYMIPAEIAVTRQGIAGAVLFVSRVGASVSYAVLFTLTTRWNDIFSGLRSLRVPRVFVVTLSMTYRYIIVLLRLIQDMYRARKSRTLGPAKGTVERTWTASRIGVIFKKSMDMSEEIYKAMLSRGFQGEFRTLDRFHLSGADYAWLAGVLLVGAALTVMERGMVH